MRMRKLTFLIAIASFGMMFLPSMVQAQTHRLVALGDSLTAGYQLAIKDAFPQQLETALRKAGYNVAVENAGVSGDTATGGLDRLDWSVPDGTSGVIVELGANDALRGLDPAITEAALDALLARLKARNIPVLLCGMLSPRNNGAEYAAKFDTMFPRLAAKHGAMLYPFFLEGVAGIAALNLADGIHPNAQGVGRVVEAIFPTVETFLKGLPAK